MGVDAVPGCYQGIICGVLNKFVKTFVYSMVAQDWIAPAGYFRDVQNFDTYVKNSVFLANLNDEWAMSMGIVDDTNPTKRRLSTLNGAMLVKFEGDHVIYPKESAWFQSLSPDGKTVLPLNATHFYTEDYIGVKELNEAGKIQWVSLPGDHLKFTKDDINNTFIPFLLS